MNPVVEEALTNMIKRIEILESKVSKISIPDENGYHKPIKSNNVTGTATPGQINYVKMLGGQTWEGMTKQEAGEQIDGLKKTKELIKKEGEMAQEMIEKFGDREPCEEPKEKQEEGAEEFPDY